MSHQSENGRYLCRPVPTTADDRCTSRTREHTHTDNQTLYQRYLPDKVKVMKCESRRLCAITLSLGGYLPLLLINVYMPCDTMSVYNENDVYSDVICKIESLMSDHVGDVLLCGDWNTDTTRRTAQTVYFKAFVERNGLGVCWNHQRAFQQDTYTNHALNQFLALTIF